MIFRLVFIPLFVLGFSLPVIGQEDGVLNLEQDSPEVKVIEEEGGKRKRNKDEQVVGEFEKIENAPQSNSKESDRNKAKKEKLKEEKKGPYLIATNSKQKLTREFKIGENVAYKSKTDKKQLRGEIEEIDKEYVKIDGKRVKIKNLVMVKKKFFKTMGWRTVGLTRFAIGVGVAAVGAGIAVFSFQQIDPNSTYVIWGALGTVFGTGVGLVGTHLMLKGSKGMFQTSKLKTEKDWKFSSKL